MGIHTLKNPKIWIAEFDVSGDMNALALHDGVDLVIATTFAHTSKKRVPGLEDPMLQLEGLWQAGSDLIDEILFNQRTTVDVPVTVCAENGAAEGSVTYFFRSIQSAYSPSGEVGNAFGFSVEAEGSQGEGLVRGTLMLNATKTVSGNGTAYQVGAVTAGQTMYAVLHVITVSGTTPTLDVVLQSDDAEGFPSPTSRITFAQANAAASEWASVAGAITDDWWRINYTIGGAGPSFAFVVAIGIL